MKRILVLGIGPLAIQPSKKFHGGGNRAWHITQSLLDAGLQVILICMRITDHQSATKPKEEKIVDGALIYYDVDEIEHFASDEYLQEKIREHQPDAIVGACDYPATRACAVAGDLPVWADIHGYPMGEAQAKAYHYQEPGYIHHFWNIHRQVLLRADRFSVTSERQRMATIGELGTMGRLNNATFGESLVVQIPIAWDADTPFHFVPRQKEDPFTVLFCGGYNLWCDEENLFVALEKAMRQDERIRFLSTGGAIDGHDEKTYPRFCERVEKSPLKDRFDLRGWVSREELESCLRKANLGINVDLPCYESLIGARNRLTEFLARGIPILTTLHTEISQIIFYKGLVLTVPTKEPDLLANEILLAANHPEKMETMAKEARTYFEEAYTYHTTTSELVAWCKNPVRSGDASVPKVRLDYATVDEDIPKNSSLLGRIKNRMLR